MAAAGGSINMLTFVAHTTAVAVLPGHLVLPAAHRLLTPAFWLSLAVLH